MSTENSVKRALDHSMVKSIIADVVTTLCHKNVPMDLASSNINELAEKIMNCALVQPIQRPDLAAADWKSAWAQQSFIALIISDASDLLVTCAVKINDSSDKSKEIHSLLTKFATALSGIVRLIHSGNDPTILLR